MPRCTDTPICTELYGDNISWSHIPYNIQRSKLFCKHRRQPRARSQRSACRSCRQHYSRHRARTLHGHSRFRRSYNIELYHNTGHSFSTLFQERVIIQAYKPVPEILHTLCGEYLRGTAADARQPVSGRCSIHCQQDDS